MTTEDYLSSKENAHVSKFTEFLWWCAGADSYFLKKSPTQDRVKYAGIGGIVFAIDTSASINDELLKTFLILWKKIFILVK
jgi:hypothetical protein